jgi:hypothetical protein
MQFRRLPPFGGDPRAVAEILNLVLDGKTNNTGLITLNTGNVTSTTLFDARISVDTKIVLIPFSDAAESDTAPYGEFLNTTDQTAPSTGTSALVEWDTTGDASGVYISDDTRINVRNAGIYNVQYNLQLANSTNAGQYADIWLRKNGSNVADTARRYYLVARKNESEPSHVVAVSNHLVDLAADDYVEVAGAVSNVGVTLEHFAADGAVPKPATPAALISINYVAPYAYSNIYVSSQSKGEAVISHFSNDTVNKTYAYILVG